MFQCAKRANNLRNKKRKLKRKNGIGKCYSKRETMRFSELQYSHVFIWLPW